MYILDLSFDNQLLYRGCVVVEVEPHKHRLVTPLDSTVVILASNLGQMVKFIPNSERDKLVLTGPVPPPIYLTAMSILGKHFRKVEHRDGRSGVSIDIPS